MNVPTALKCEWDQLQKQARGTHFWWVIRFGICFGLLQAPLNSLLPEGALWSVLSLAVIPLCAVFLWWLTALAFESERTRIETKKPFGFWSRLWGALPVALVGSVFILVIRHSIQPSLISLIVLGAFIFVMEQTLAVKRSSFDLLDAREQALRAKLAPHFIFNTLNTLHAQIEADPRGAQATTERLAMLFRQVIEASDLPTIPLKEELGFVEAYLGIEKARLGERLTVRVDIPEDVECALVPPLSLQVLVENAVKHGIAPLERGGEIRISARRQGSDLVVEVSDPGTGMRMQDGTDIGTKIGTGTALETLRSRLASPGDLSLTHIGDHTVASFRWRQK